MDGLFGHHRSSRWYSEKTAIIRLNIRPAAVLFDWPSRETTSAPASFISSMNDSKRATVRARQFHSSGALLDAVSLALRQLPEVRLERLPRMAEFAQWVVAAEEGLGFKEGDSKYTRDATS